MHADDAAADGVRHGGSCVADSGPRRAVRGGGLGYGGAAHAADAGGRGVAGIMILMVINEMLDVPFFDQKIEIVSFHLKCT